MRTGECPNCRTVLAFAAPDAASVESKYPGLCAAGNMLRRYGTFLRVLAVIEVVGCALALIGSGIAASNTGSVLAAKVAGALFALACASVVLGTLQRAAGEACFALAEIAVNTAGTGAAAEQRRVA
jgi:hypothetical protein